jgi:hypothetical protein
MNTLLENLVVLLFRVYNFILLKVLRCTRMNYVKDALYVVQGRAE